MEFSEIQIADNTPNIFHKCQEGIDRLLETDIKCSLFVREMIKKLKMAEKYIILKKGVRKRCGDQFTNEILMPKWCDIEQSSYGKRVENSGWRIYRRLRRGVV